MAISIHALREEGDHYARYVGTDGTLFLSTPSARRATFEFVRLLVQGVQFLSTPSARRATEGGRNRLADYCISIHALREEGDVAERNFKIALTDISIHALREEGDPGRPGLADGHQGFLSTPSARRATGEPRNLQR